MNTALLLPHEVDDLLRYPAGKTERLAKAGKIEAITLPDGAIRIAKETVDKLLAPTAAKGDANA